MNFLYFEVKLGELNAVRVELSGTAANVKVMDDHNFRQYKSGRPHRYYGGHYDRSPAVIKPPSSGRWYVTVDTGGLGGAVKANVSVV